MVAEVSQDEASKEAEFAARKLAHEEEMDNLGSLADEEYQLIEYYANKLDYMARPTEMTGETRWENLVAIRGFHSKQANKIDVMRQNCLDLLRQCCRKIFASHQYYSTSHYAGCNRCGVCKMDENNPRNMPGSSLANPNDVVSHYEEDEDAATDYIDEDVDDEPEDD